MEALKVNGSNSGCYRNNFLRCTSNVLANVSHSKTTLNVTPSHIVSYSNNS